MKKNLSFLLIIFLLANLFTICSATSVPSPVKSVTFKLGSPKMIVDGVSKDIDPNLPTTPLIANNRVMIPIRSFIEVLGGKVEWSSNEHLTAISLNSNEILLWIDSNIAYSNKEALSIEIPPIIHNSRTYLPIRFICENLGFSVTWNQLEKSILIDTTKTNPIPNNDQNNSSKINFPTYTVIQGDTLWAITKKYNISIKTLLTINNLTNDKIYVGQVLNIPPNSQPPTANLPSNILPENQNIIEQIISGKSDSIDKILNNPNKYEVQILYTNIKRTLNSLPTFTSYQYKLSENNYFYPASTVKLITSTLALEKINNLKIPNLTKDSHVDIHPSKVQNGDSGTIANYIKNALIYSDNNSFDRLYEFLGQEYINSTLYKKGYNKSLILHRLGKALNYEQNRNTNSMTFSNNNSNIYHQEAQYNLNTYSNIGLNNLQRGNSHFINGQIINSPKDFSQKNYASIVTLQNILKAIVFPECVPENARFNLTTDDKNYLLENMKNSTINNKFFICGAKDPIPAGLKIYNKSGIAYGNLIDNAYIIDENTKKEFLLTAVIYVNNDGVIGDDVYEYTSIGYPFFKDMSTAIYNYNNNH